MEWDYRDYVIVGAGLSGAVVAERIANVLKKKVWVLEKRQHIGGNCYDYIDDNGLRINKYGAHIFHTNNERVYDYITSFSEWIRYDHKVLSYVDDQYVPIPVNINTVNKLYNLSIRNKVEMKQWLESVQVKYDQITNSEEMCKSRYYIYPLFDIYRYRVGNDLYEKLFKDYTYKQWNKYPKELDASVLARIPIRMTHDDRYFTDKYQLLPKDGYTSFIGKLLNHELITVKLNTDFFDIKDEISFCKLIYTGPIDQYYANSGYEKLEYRSIDFVEHRYKNTNFVQPASVVNYPKLDVPYTRIVEYKHFWNQFHSPHTTIVCEYSHDSAISISENREPYYPVPNERNLKLYERYKQLTETEHNVYFVGRLANYKYFNMDEAILNSLILFDDIYENKNK